MCVFHFEKSNTPCETLFQEVFYFFVFTRFIVNVK
jgi:hypothetical protein